MIRILVNGAHGKMGTEIITTMHKHADEFLLVAGIGKTDDLKKAILAHTPDIVIDVTRADTAFKNAEIIVGANVHPVIGTSGLRKDEIVLLQKLCKEKSLGGVIAPNFSLGAILMIKCAKEIAKYFNHAEIIESHHAGKQDSPSGTAIRTAEVLVESNENIAGTETCKENIAGARGARYENIPIHSIRLPGVIADQEIIFGAPGETLSIHHRTIDRQCFMPGVLLACRKAMTLDHLVYGLEGLV